MRMVRLPIDGRPHGDVRLALWRDHRIDVPVNALAGGLWARISAQIYNDMDDYRRLAEAVPRL
jgi:isopenicillin-N epimerase